VSGPASASLLASGNQLRLDLNMARSHFLIGAPVTGQTPFYWHQMQDWAKQYYNQQDIECYCLDAPMYIPTGVTRTIGSGQHRLGQALFVNREQLAMYSFWFCLYDSPVSGDWKLIECSSLTMVQKYWDALNAAGFFMKSARP
jgi:hypothetical protein